MVIDDRVAFCGGLDLTARRWDTCDHRPGDERRKADDTPYPPFHDLMMMVDGEAARALGTLARERWRLATGRQIKPARPGPDSWPPDVEPQVTDAMVAISRTLPHSTASAICCSRPDASRTPCAQFVAFAIGFWQSIWALRKSAWQRRSTRKAR
ncbi:MAG: phospholipase D-like domain-containing protein [Burkholderiales bacterium]